MILFKLFMVALVFECGAFASTDNKLIQLFQNIKATVGCNEN